MVPGGGAGGWCRGGAVVGGGGLVYKTVSLNVRQSKHNMNRILILNSDETESELPGL